jgi:hypothetical protein
MCTSVFRWSRLPLALAFVAALAACTDELTPTDPVGDLEPRFGLGDEIIVTNTSGGTEIGSLRWALRQGTGGEVIRFDPSLAGKTIVLDSTIYAGTKSVTIEGPAGQGITIRGNGTGRVFEFSLSFSGTLVLRNLTITGGRGANLAGIAIHAPGATVTVENSTFTDNEGGAYPAFVGGNVTLINSTVSGNKVTLTSFPYAAVLAKELKLVNSTVAHNVSVGVEVTTQLVLRNSVLANNDLDNCDAPMIVREASNVSDDDTCGAPFEIIIGDPMLAPLADNGGPSWTHALMAGSPAINAGTNCSVSVDQRYVTRDAQCDLGAFEFIDFTTVDLTMAASGTIDKNNGWAIVTGTVKCSRGEHFDLHVELHQMQKRGQNSVDVHAAATTPVVCSTNVQPWSVGLVTTDDPFEMGTAEATVGTLNTEPWVTPASLSQSVKLFNGRK